MPNYNVNRVKSICEKSMRVVLNGKKVEVRAPNIDCIIKNVYGPQKHTIRKI